MFLDSFEHDPIDLIFGVTVHATFDGFNSFYIDFVLPFLGNSRNLIFEIYKKSSENYKTKSLALKAPFFGDAWTNFQSRKITSKLKKKEVVDNIYSVVVFCKLGLVFSLFECHFSLIRLLVLRVFFKLVAFVFRGVFVGHSSCLSF